MLNDKQCRVVYDLTGNTIVSASPGSGKTKTLVARAQHKLETIPFHKSLALITYTNAGADEIAYRLADQDYKVFIGTIHRFCLEFILRPFGWIFNWHKPRVVTYNELNEFIEENKTLDLGSSPLDELNKIKKTLDGNLDTTVVWNNLTDIQTVANAFYDFLQNRKAIDFNEILYRSYKIIKEKDFVISSLANKFYEISIDEFQDTNIYQYEILKAIQQKKICTFFMVGDEKQRIYRFAGAIDNAFKRASLDFDAPIEILEVNYRSTSNIINTYSSLFENHPELINESEYKSIDYKVIFQQTKKDDHNTIVKNYIEYLVNKGNIEPSEIAILSLQWRDALSVSKALRNKFRIVGLGALPHKSLNNSTFNLVRCLSRFSHSITVKSLRIIRRAIELHVLENNLTISNTEFNYITNSLISKFGQIDNSLSLKDGIFELQKVFDIIFKVSHSAFDELLYLLDDDEAEQWTFEKYIETLSGVAGITINTIHQAKGLEYKVVILNQINENKIPYQMYLGQQNGNYIYEDLTEESIEDGRTLLYVGLSRAQAVLVILHNWKPSMFIQTLKSVNT
ncbi:ATP-dependent helicase [Apibacter raozihei]|uniref:UvrD-helicase domain-containing protein n=1 Tax=Apibacter raozihei TaxID=2500547 RepID=UPI000FE360F7|nr:ATP-dependent helicase [Apibacter raozihei]